MAITYPLSLPAVKAPSKITLSAVSVVGISASPFSGKQQIQEHPGQWWEGIMSFPIMRPDNADIWIAWLYSLHGATGTFELGEMTRLNRGSSRTTPGTPQVDGSNQQGNQLMIKTGLSTTAGYFKVNDRFSLGTGASRRLHRVVQDADLDGDGNATLEIWPRLRVVPLNNDPLYTSGATGLFRFTDNKVNTDEDAAGNIQLNELAFREAI